MLTSWEEEALSEADPVWTLCPHPGTVPSSSLEATA